MDPWYFAYGSNLHHAQLIERCGQLSASDEPPRLVRLPNYRVAFNLDGGDGEVYANIITPGNGVLGVIYRCNAAALAKLDVYETGYDRLDVTVIDEHGSSLPAFAYIAQSGNVTAERRPAAEYLQIILTGARAHGLPLDYIREIESRAAAIA